MKRFLKIAIPAAVLVLTSAGTFGGEPKVTICHYPPGNPANFQIITVGQSAVAAHVANHGDNTPLEGTPSAQCPNCGGCPGPGVE